MVSDKMTLTQAIHMMREDQVRCERLARDLGADPLDCEGRCVRWAKVYREKAQAIALVVEAAQGKTNREAEVADG